MNKLTREEILAMEPGRELNRLIAEKVLKSRHVDAPVEFSDKDWFDYHHDIIGIFHYSSNISDALNVLEKMRTNKIYLDIRVWPDEYQVLPHHDENNKLIDRWIVKSPSLPEAICKAALLAVLEGEA